MVQYYLTNNSTSFPITRNITSIGRDFCTIPLESLECSSHHASVFVISNGNETILKNHSNRSSIHIYAHNDHILLPGHYISLYVDDDIHFSETDVFTLTNTIVNIIWLASSDSTSQKYL